MDERDYESLVSIRLDRAKELYSEAVELVNMDCYNLNSPSNYNEDGVGNSMANALKISL